MTRGIDHLVLAARDLAAVAAFYERLGFTLTPQAQHPFGTGNRLVQLQGGFLELLSVTEPDWIAGPGPGQFSFGAYNRDYLAAREGMSMIALQSADWQQDRTDFEAAGLALPAPFAFSRMAKQPDGSEIEMGFDLTFAPDTTERDAMFFTCCHRHRPDQFYKPAFQAHANGARRIARVTYESPNPAATQRRLAALGVDESLFDLRAGSGAARFSGCRVSVDDLAALGDRLAGNDIAFEDQDGVLAIAPEAAFGVTLEFCEEKTT